jgi:Uma2 family endonuclease
MFPDIAVEVISPSIGAAESAEKVWDYFQAGTQLVWVISQGRSLLMSDRRADTLQQTPWTYAHKHDGDA